MKRKKEPLTIGIDIGGTSIKIGLVQGRRILVRQTLPTAQFKTPQALQDGLVESVRMIRPKASGPIAGIGIGVPGLVRYPEGIVRTCANIPGWKDVPLRALLQKRLHLPVRVDNDANVMTLAEWKYGAGVGTTNLVCITLGTGVGGGLVLDGRIYRGEEGSAGEIGHMPVSNKGPTCSCGGKGCLERFVGNKEIVQWVRKQLRAGVRSRLPALVGNRLELLTPEVISTAAHKGDPLARRCWERTGHLIGIALAGVVNLLNPEKIVIGGGVAQAGHWLLDPMRKTVREQAMRGLKETAIVPARLGSDAGLIGAALLVQDNAE